MGRKDHEQNFGVRQIEICEISVNNKGKRPDEHFRIAPDSYRPGPPNSLSLPIDSTLLTQFHL